MSAAAGMVVTEMKTPMRVPGGRLAACPCRVIEQPPAARRPDHPDRMMSGQLQAVTVTIND
jgi:hypothetical protein